MRNTKLNKTHGAFKVRRLGRRRFVIEVIGERGNKVYPTESKARSAIQQIARVWFQDDEPDIPTVFIWPLPCNLKAPPKTPPCEHEENMFEVYKAMEWLTDHEKYVLTRRFGLDGGKPGSGIKGCCDSLEEIGKRLKVHRERVKQIQEKALRKIRKRLRWREIDWCLAQFNKFHPGRLAARKKVP